MRRQALAAATAVCTDGTFGQVYDTPYRSAVTQYASHSDVAPVRGIGLMEWGGRTCLQCGGSDLCLDV